MEWFHAIVERDHHLQNPTSVDKIRSLVSKLSLPERARVLDLASGKGGPATLLASELGCRVTCVELNHEFVVAARARAEDAGVTDLVDVFEADAIDFPYEPGVYDLAMCLGAVTALGGLGMALDRLGEAARPGGYVVIGEVFWRAPPADGTQDYGALSLDETVRALETHDLSIAAIIESSDDEWHQYESLHWRAAEAWLATHPDDERADTVRNLNAYFKDYYAKTRDTLGWAMFAGRKA